LRALYDIRVKEAHHYNTLIWAFPLAYATLLAAEAKLLDPGGPLLIAAVFNVTLCYVFARHLRTRKFIQKALKFTEKKLEGLYGSDFVPGFPADRRFPPKATTVISLSMGVVTALFIWHAVHSMWDSTNHGPPPTDACRQAIRDHFHQAISPSLVFTFKEASRASLDDPDKPGNKVDGWLFEATWDFPPTSGSHLPMASRFLARGDTVVLYAPLGADFRRWEKR